MTVDCDCPQCHNRRGRVWAWLEAEPGPGLMAITWLLAAIFLLALWFWPE